MQACATETVRLACKFRPEFANLLESEKLDLMAGCFEVIGPVFRECAAKNERLVDWIVSGQDR